MHCGRTDRRYAVLAVPDAVNVVAIVIVIVVVAVVIQAVAEPLSV